jgi:hypothetical protein
VWKARASFAPPVTNHASLPPFRTNRHVPLAANAPSPSHAGGMTCPGSVAHVAPPSCVARTRNLPFTGSPSTSPSFSSKNAIAS